MSRLLLIVYYDSSRLLVTYEENILMVKHKILIIDDDQGVLNMLRQYLMEAGYAVGIADRGAYGVRCACEERPDLVILDVAMPEMNGYEVMAKIRAECDVPVVMLTGHAQLDDVLNEDDPPDAFVQKPTSMKQLLATIEYLLVPSSGL